MTSSISSSTMQETKLLFVSALFASIFATASANIYFNDLVIPAVPVYYGKEPFIGFGNITAFLTVGNATNAKGNLVLCPTFSSPTEDMLMWCAQGDPAGIISVFPPISETEREVHLGRSMYTDVGMSYWFTPEKLRQSHIIEIDMADFGTLAGAIGSNLTVTIDGSTPNEWFDMYQGPLGVISQVIPAIFSGCTTIYTIFIVWRWWRNDMLKPQLQTYIAFVNIASTALRCLYCAFSPTGLRRLLASPNDFIVNTLFLMATICSCLMFSLYLLQTLLPTNLKVEAFLKNPKFVGIFVASLGGWFLYLIGIRIAMADPASSPLGTGYGMLAIICIQEILLGTAGLIYASGAIAMLVKLAGMKRKWKQRVYDFVHLGVSTLSIWFLFTITAIAFGPVWQIPIIPGVTQILCNIFQTLIQLLQTIAADRATRGGTGNSSRGRKSSLSGTHGKTVATATTKSHTSSADATATQTAELSEYSASSSATDEVDV